MAAQVELIKPATVAGAQPVVNSFTTGQEQEVCVELGYHLRKQDLLALVPALSVQLRNLEHGLLTSAVTLVT